MKYDYLLLDPNNFLEEVGTITSKELAYEWNCSENKVRFFLDKNRLFKDKYVVIENDINHTDIKEQKELFEMFDESENRIWYVSNQGNVVARIKGTKKKTTLSQRINARGEIEIKANSKYYVLKNLVAKYFCKDWEPGSIVFVIDKSKPITPENVCVQNKTSFFRELQNNRVQKPVGYFENGKCIRKWDSIKSCAKDLYMDSSTLAKQLKKNKSPNIRFI